ncbi:NAD(P)/FAD-dependent oxidoreductase [Priestia megaterium]|uniref:NAD(P)/FAD-dependent oxidoreductase n=1 Tax=Priestia megaterium TaxID=1404 RepID=UPI000BF6B302|nr:NAD(P)/FAD-dependent oxidoreductase [Priestia megaterium]MED4061058.1 NAD(P)/FAD-dependent oxidoreductase [Priestia megaterium]PEZ07134.1 pyridine nucleotide-disulfide oxidoreductase [Priestia megaterium]
MSKHILILGGGYGGLLAAMKAREHLNEDDAKITVVNRFSTHQIITELHRLAAGSISEKAVSLPLDKLLKNYHVDLKISTVNGISPNKHEVSLEDGKMLTYDYLVVALGSETAYFGIPGLKENSFVLKSVDDANRLRSHVEERIAEYSKTHNKAAGTIVVGGAGLTGTELVGEYADLMPNLCLKYGVDPQEISLYCVEASPTVLAGFPPKLVERAYTSLTKRGVTFITGTPVTRVDGKIVELKDGRKIETETLVWAGGIQGNSVVANSNMEVSRGRVLVNEFLQPPSQSDIFVAGDSAVVMGPDGTTYPPTAQLAWQMGENIGENLSISIRGGVLKPFVPIFSGTLASLGRKDAVGTVGENKTELKGVPAALMKQASDVRYLSHIKGLFSLAY